MKRNLLLTLIIAMSLPMLGNPIDENTAKQLAQNFWKENNIMGVKGDKVFKKRMDDARFVNVATRCGYSEFYIFNNEGGKGFVIIAADDCVTPILAYSYDNNFAAENLPPNLKGWLDGYAEQIRMAVEMRATASDEIRADWECLRQGRNLPIKSETAVDHLLSTTWGQGDYYNLLCPEDNSSQYGGHALTGCAATAMAQILKFWEYPNDAHSVGWHEYEHPVYGTLGAYYGYDGGSYYWNFMPNQLNFSTPLNQKQAVASLMYHCGVSVEMNYGPTVSLANAQSAEIAFRAFFDYNNATLVTRLPNDTQWINLLKNEIDNERPVYYAGTGPDGGHAFVCDGYDNNNFFGFNWGFGGQGDGFFPINSLTPSVNGHQFDFSNNQHAIIGIEPGGTNNYHLLAMNDDIKLNGYYGNMYYFDTQIQEITTEVYNWGNTAFNGSLCAVVFDGERQYMAASEFINNCQISSMQSSGQLSFTFSESLNILSCKAYVGIYSIENNQYSLVSTYGMHQNPSEFYNYYTFSEDVVELYLYSNIEYSPSPIAQNSAISVTANIINDDPNSSFNGYIAAALYDLDGELKQILATLYEENGLQPGYYYTNTLNFSCPSVTVPAGTYYLTIIQQPEGSDNWYPLLNWEDCVNPVHVNPIRVEVVGPVTYTVTATSNPSNGGTITGQGSYLEGETCTLTATANNGYTFVNWTENGTQVSTNATYSSTVTGDRNLVANFQVQQQQQYSVSVLANPSNGGSVNGSGTYQQGQSCTISATANTGYSFFQWNDGTTTNPRTITVTQDTTFVAFFRDNNNQGNGCFSVSASNKVIISPGNLQFQASTGIWRFAEHQYDIIGEANSNISPNYDGWIDLFGWGTSGWNCGNTYYHPYDTETGNNAYYYYGPLGNFSLIGQYANSDWGVYNAISNGGNEAGQWRTLSSTEFNYLINTRPNATAKRSLGTINDVHGLILLPDEWTQPTGINYIGDSNDWTTNNFSISQWQMMEANGAVFLPASGNRGYTTISMINSRGSYWSTDSFNGYAALALRFDLSTLEVYDHNYYRCAGLAVRLVQEYRDYSIIGISNPQQGGVISGCGIYASGATCTLNATPNTNYSFVNWTENGVQVSSNPSYSFIVTSNRTIKANFLYSPSNYYTVNVSANPYDGGSVDGGGTYFQGQACTVTALTNSGYSFVNWTEAGIQISTDPSYTFSVTSNRNLVANFEIQLPEYSVSVSANPSNGGNIIGGGIYTQGQSCTVNATANDGYSFVNWTENGTQVSTNENYTFAVTSNRNLVANFEIQLPEYSVSVSANPSNGGNVIGGGIYTQGQSCTVSATANDGYSFVNWTENGTLVSTNANYSFEVTGNRTLVANFQIQNYTISVSANPSNGGMVTGGGTFEYGQTCTVTANSGNGYNFVNWAENGVQVSTNANYSFTVTGNRTLVGNFTSQSYVITATADPSAGGVITGSGGYNYGETCTLTVTANTGYTFVNWTKNGSQVSTNPTYSFTVTESANYVAHFNLQSYSITVSAYPNNAGSVTGGGTYTYGQSCTVHATANSGYTFVNWTENGTQVSTNANYTFTVTNSRNLVAHFQQQQQQYTISVSANPSNGGSVSGGGSFNQGTSCTVHATANSGFTFINWTENGTQVSTNANYSFTVTGNRNLVANFAQSEHTIQATAGANGIITPSGTVTVAHGANQSFAMIPDAGYEIQDVYIDGNSVGALTSYTFTNVTANHYIHVTFVHVDGVDDNNILSVVVYPNPTSGEVTIECERLSHVRIVNTFGQTVYNADHEGNQTIIDLSQMAKGIYMMHIEAEDGQMVRKIVVE